MDRASQGFVITTLSIILVSIKGLYLNGLLDSGAEVFIIIKKLID